MLFLWLEETAELKQLEYEGVGRLRYNPGWKIFMDLGRQTTTKTKPSTVYRAKKRTSMASSKAMT